MELSREDQAAMAQGKTFVWHEITTSDVAGAITFYTETLDFGTLEMPMGDMGNYKMLTRGGTPVCGVTEAHSGIAPHWATYLSVDDVDAKIELTTSKGAKLIVPAMDVPTVGRMAMIQDPQGAYLWLFKSETA
jgi:predicted enzyme related to lactoylglutathione lyase